MVEIISVRFQSGGKQYYFNPDGRQFQIGDRGHRGDLQGYGVR